MARPKTPSKRTERAPTMYTPEELAVMKSNAREARMTPSAYRRFMTTGVKPDKKLPSVKEEALLQGIVALQQISRSIEKSNGVISAEAISELTAIRQLISKGLEK